MRVLFAAGGTGGHIFPAISVAQALRKQSSELELIFVGVGKQIERDLASANGYNHVEILCPPITGKGVWGFLKFLCIFPFSIIKALKLFRSFKPDVVIGFGGYPSFVPLFAAWLKGIPSILQEQNVKVGFANRLLSRFVTQIFAIHGAKGFAAGKKVTHLDNPVREQFYDISGWSLPASGEKLRILIVGGSQGAVSLNKAVEKLTDVFKKHDCQVTHQAGSLDLERLQKVYADSGLRSVEVTKFINDMPAAYEQAHLIICRAGALTVAEVAAARRPAIFVPLVIAAGHQAENVTYLLKKDAAFMLEQNEQLPGRLKELVLRLIEHPEQLSSCAQALHAMKPTHGARPAERIAQGICSLIEE